MQYSDKVDQLAAAFAVAQGKFGVVPLNSTNPHLHTRYADLGSVIETARDILSENGLSVLQFVNGSGDSIGVTSVLMHSSGQWMSDTVSVPYAKEPGKSPIQAAGSTVTYLRRYALAALLGLYAGDDDDGTGGDQTERKTTTVKTNAAPVKKEQAEELPVVEITWLDGSTKNGNALVDIATVNRIMQKFVGGDKVFKTPNDLKNELRRVFHVDKPQELNYEKALAFVKHLNGEDDGKWYSASETTPKVVKTDQGYEPKYLDALVVKWKGTGSYSELPDETKLEVLTLLNSGTVDVNDLETIAGILAAG